MNRLLCVGCVAAMTALAGVETAGGASLLIGKTGDGPVSILPAIGAVTKRINIDGQPVDILVQVSNVSFVTASFEQKPTVARVDLITPEGDMLPEVTAVRIRLERIRPPMRIVRKALFPEVTAANVPQSSAGYVAELTNFIPGARLKATVTVVTPDETRVVRVGNVRVRPSMVVPVGPILNLD
jgi:hypothetical protein